MELTKEEIRRYVKIYDDAVFGVNNCTLYEKRVIGIAAVLAAVPETGLSNIEESVTMAVGEICGNLTSREMAERGWRFDSASLPWLMSSVIIDHIRCRRPSQPAPAPMPEQAPPSEVTLGYIAPASEQAPDVDVVRRISSIIWGSFPANEAVQKARSFLIGKAIEMAREGWMPRTEPARAGQKEAGRG